MYLELSILVTTRAVLYLDTENQSLNILVLKYPALKTLKPQYLYMFKGGFSKAPSLLPNLK